MRHETHQTSDSPALPYTARPGQAHHQPTLHTPGKQDLRPGSPKAIARPFRRRSPLQHILAPSHVQLLSPIPLSLLLCLLCLLCYACQQVINSSDTREPFDSLRNMSIGETPTRLVTHSPFALVRTNPLSGQQDQPHKSSTSSFPSEMALVFFGTGATMMQRCAMLQSPLRSLP